MFAIIGCPLSGTTYTTMYLQELDVEVEHEKFGPAGGVGWDLFLRWPKVTMSCHPIIHLVRDPLKAIGSMNTLSTKHWRKIEKFFDDPWWVTEDHQLLKVMKFYGLWNASCAKMAQSRFRVEDLFPGGVAHDLLCNRLNIDDYGCKPDIAENTNTRSNRPDHRDDITWEMLLDIDDAYEKYIRGMAQVWGYDSAWGY